jgi:hypothetical protein
MNLSYINLKAVNSRLKQYREKMKKDSLSNVHTRNPEEINPTMKAIAAPGM